MKAWLRVDDGPWVEMPVEESAEGVRVYLEAFPRLGTVTYEWRLE
jgi:hypothetical protein